MGYKEDTRFSYITDNMLDPSNLVCAFKDFSISISLYTLLKFGREV